MKLSFTTVGIPSQPAVLFLHGFLGLGSDWLELATDLVQDYHCILPDLPGHGGSVIAAEDPPIDMESAVSAILALIDDLQIDRTALVGYSMGGRVALYMARKFPQRIVALVVESANPGIKDAGEREARAALDDLRAEMIERKGLAAFVEQWYKAPLFASMLREPERLSQLKRSRLVHNPQSLAAALRGLTVGRQASLWESLGELKLPVCVISGSLDDKYGKISALAAAQIPNCRRAVIAAAGHNTHLERPQEFLALLREFLHDTKTQTGSVY